MERRLEGAGQAANERLRDAREARESQEDLLQTRHDFATRHGATRTILKYGSVGGDATEGLPLVDESVASEPVVPVGDRRKTSRDGAVVRSQLTIWTPTS